ncbi:hypothetical protein B7494_g3978 [Chlorociboria aeruginascens]|nr:hypothetical protein B7494_g3978 [Chlorociboria aeruginascens]
MAPNMSLFSVNAIIILSTEDGSRIFAKYYTAPHHSSTSQPDAYERSEANAKRIVQSSPATPYADVKSQKAFEKGLLEKTAKQSADIILYDNRIVLYKAESDVMMYVVGSVDENEIMLYNVILAVRDSLHLLFRYLLSCFTFLPFILYPHFLPLVPAFCFCTLRLRQRRQAVDKRTIIENYDLMSLTIDEIVDDGIILETDPTIIVQRVSKAPTQDVAQLQGIDLSEQGMNNLAQFGKQKLGTWLRQGL